MSDLNKDLSKKFINYLDQKQYKRLQFEADMLGEIEDQHPLIMFYYASSIYLNEASKNKDLLYASQLYERVYKSNKKHLQSLYNMLAVSFKTKSFKNVLPLALEAYKENNNDPKLIEGLARVNFYLGNRQDSLKLFKILYQMLPDKKEGRLPFISSLNYTSGISQEEYMKECLNYNSILEKKYNIENNQNQFNWNKSNKINLAFLSADFKTHSVSHFLLDLLKKIDKSKFNIYLISNLKIIDQDNMSQELKKLVYKWLDVHDFSDDDLTSFLRSLKLDTLIDLSGFTNGNRFEVLIRRCAKVQIEWLGYNNSLGAKNIDYLISDKNLIKSNEINSYKEDILFMPNIWNALSPPEKLPEINDKLNKKNSDFVFCSFNNFQKISDRTINVWSQILKISQSKLLLKNSLIGGEDLKNNVLDKFILKGVQKEQITFLEREKNIYDHLKLYNKANVALDTFPYPGVTTSYEAILMGLPVLTMQGFNFNSRCGENINKNINMDNLIAKDDHDYINIAISLLKEPNLNEMYGKKLREKALLSTLFNTDQFTRDFEELITEVYNKN
tara:strand:+ start:22 stop:1695 length:1674 start_codon:yes stop_codon:yes gene_type:complete